MAEKQVLFHTVGSKNYQTLNKNEFFMSNTMFFTLTDWGTIRKQNNLFEGLKK